MDSHAILAEIPRLRRYARAMLGERAAADDLVQDTLERAWSRIGQWRPGSDLRAWLFGIMHNLRVDQLRRADPPARPLEESDGEFPVPAAQSDGLELQDLESALGRLPEEQREVLLLRLERELSLEEIAEITGVGRETVKSRLRYAMDKLRARLAP